MISPEPSQSLAMLAYLTFPLKHWQSGIQLPRSPRPPRLVLTGGQGHKGVAGQCASARAALGESYFSYGPWATTAFCFSRNWYATCLPKRKEEEGTHSQPHITPRRASDFSPRSIPFPSLEALIPFVCIPLAAGWVRKGWLAKEEGI